MLPLFSSLLFSLLCKGAGHEKTIFSDRIDKINHKGVIQRRVLQITDRAMYNLMDDGKYNKCKRRIDITEVHCMKRSSSSTQFVFNISSEYDYHYASDRVEALARTFRDVYQSAVGQPLQVVTIDARDLHGYVITKKESKKMRKQGGAAALSANLVDDMAGLSVAGKSGAGGAGRQAGAATTTAVPGFAPGGGKVNMSHFELLKVIGKGSFGKVMMVRKKDSGGVYAMKVLSKDAVISRNQLEHTKAERHILEAVQHPFLAGLCFAFQSETKLYLVLEYLNGGELFFHLKKAGRFSEDRARLYAAEIVLALGHLHSLGIIYRDLKPENILLDSEGHVRVTDFGLCKESTWDNSSAKTFCGTPEYLAPEILQAKGHGRAVDWWSLGTLLFEMIVGLPPFYDSNVNVMYRKILSDKLVFPPQMSAHAKDILAKLLDRNPASRLGSGATDMMELTSHPFFASINWQKLRKKEIPAPYKPTVRDNTDVSNFDACFTSEEVKDTFVENSHLTEAQKAERKFDNFTFVAPSALG